MSTIKTVLQLDDQDMKKKLEAANVYLKKTYGDWIEATNDLTIVDRKLIAEKEKLTKATDSEKNAIKANIKQLQLEKNAIKAKQSATKSEHITMKQATVEMEKNTLAKKTNVVATKALAKTQTNFSNTIVRHLRQIETLVIAYYTLSRGITATIGKGIEINRMMEDNSAGIAALLSANSRMVLSNGQMVTSYEKFQIGLKVAETTMDDLRKASVKTFATFPQLTEIFQQAIGQTLSMGKSFGTTTDQIIENTIKLSQRMSNIAGAIGMPMDRAREEIRSLLSGNASTDSLISTMIFGSPTKANEAIRAAKKRGANGVKELLDSILAPFDQLEELKTFSRSLLTFEDAWANTMRRLVDESGAFKDIQGIIDDFSSELNTNVDGIVNSFDRVYESSKKAASILYEPLGLIAGIYALTKAWKALNIAVKANPFVAVGTAIATMSLAVANAVDYERDKKVVSTQESRYRKTYDPMTKNSTTDASDIKLAEKLSNILLINQTRLIEKAESLSNVQKSALKTENKLILENLNILGNRIGKTKEQIALEEEKRKKAGQALAGAAKLQQNLAYNMEIVAEGEKDRRKGLSEEIKLRDKLQKQQEALKKFKENLSEAANDVEIEQAQTLINKTKLNIANYQNQIDEVKQKAYEKEVARQEALKKKREKEFEELASDLEKPYIQKEEAEKKLLEQQKKRQELVYSIQEKMASLIVDETEREKALAKISHDRAIQKLKDLKEEDKANEDLYDKKIELKEKAYKKTIEGLSKEGQLTETITSALKSGMTDFFDVTSDGFMDMENLATDVLGAIANKLIELSVINPLVSAATPAITSFVGNLFADGGVMTSQGSMPLKTYATGGIANSPQVAVYGEGKQPEAYVPLPDGRSIPVTMSGAMQGSGQQSTTTIINLENQSGQQISLEKVQESMTQDPNGELVKTIGLVIQGLDQNTMRIRDILGAS